MRNPKFEFPPKESRVCENHGTTSELTLNPSLKKRGTLKNYSFLPFSFQEKGLGDEFVLSRIFFTNSQSPRDKF